MPVTPTTIDIDTILSIAAMVIAFLVYLNNRKKADNDTLLAELKALSEKRDKLRADMDVDLQRMQQRLTDCKKEAQDAQDALEQRMNSRMSHLLDMLPDPIALIDEEGNIEDCNYKFSSRFGYMVDELRDKPLSILIPDESKKVHEFGFERMQDEEDLSPQYRNRTLTAISKDRVTMQLAVHLSRRPTRTGYIYAVTLKK